MLALYVILFFSILPWSPTIYKPILVEQFIYYFVLAVILIFVANSAKDIIGRSVGGPHRSAAFTTRARLTRGGWWERPAGRAHYLIKLSLLKKARETARIQQESERLLKTMLPESIAERCVR